MQSPVWERLQSISPPQAFSRKLLGSRAPHDFAVVASILVKVAECFFLKQLSLFLCKNAFWAGKMIQWTEMPATSTDDF